MIVQVIVVEVVDGSRAGSKNSFNCSGGGDGELRSCM